MVQIEVQESKKKMEDVQASVPVKDGKCKVKFDRKYIFW